VRDSAGTTRPAALSYASPDQVNFRVPEDSAEGFGTVTYAAGGNTYTAGIYIVASYPHLFTTPEGRPAGHVIRVRGGQQVAEPVTAPVTLGSDEVYLVFYGSGLGKSTEAAVTIGGVEAPVLYAGPQGVYGGLDQFNVRVPAALAGRGLVEVVVTVDGRPSNPVRVEFR
jgi:uncharacterized protein (TIGR03437 family)